MNDLKQIVDAANANERLMDGTTGPVIAILAANDLAWAVWPDQSANNGASTLILKGKRRLEAIAAAGAAAPAGTVRVGNESVPLRWSAIKVLNKEMAIAAMQELGENY